MKCVLFRNWNQYKLRQNTQHDSIRVLRYLLYKFFFLWGNISHSRYNKSNQFQPKGDVEKTEPRHIMDVSLEVREMFKIGLRVRRNE